MVVCEESSSSCPAAGAGAAAVLLCCCTAGAGEGSDGGCSVDGAVLAAWRIKIERNKYSFCASSNTSAGGLGILVLATMTTTKPDS